MKKVITKCGVCHKEFMVDSYELKRGNGKYCSLSCCAKKSDEHQTGFNNPNWKSGISKNNYHYKLIQKERYPDRLKARQIAYDARRRGKLIAQPCTVCGNPDVEMHHQDYSKPLKVDWLCEPHHREVG